MKNNNHEFYGQAEFVARASREMAGKLQWIEIEGLTKEQMMCLSRDLLETGTLLTELGVEAKRLLDRAGTTKD